MSNNKIEKAIEATNELSKHILKEIDKENAKLKKDRKRIVRKGILGRFFE